MNDWNCNCDAVYEMGQMEVGVDEICHYAAAVLSDTSLRSLIARLQSSLAERPRHISWSSRDELPVAQPAEAVSDVVS